jgi:phage recombination protein Bet
METALAKREEFTISMDDVKKYVAPGATDKELFVFMGVAKSYGLNPLKREIHFVKYGQNPGQVIVGYESYIKRAERTTLLDGWKVWIADIGKPEERAIIEIRRKDFSQPFTWEVYRKEFDKGQANWKSMPTFMLKKVAIAQGFRLAFPSEIGGMPYIPEELPKEKGGGGTSEELDKGVIDVEKAPPASRDAPREDIPAGLDKDPGASTDQLFDGAGQEQPPIDFPNAKAAPGYDKGKAAVLCPKKEKGKQLAPKTDCVTCTTSSTCVAWAA